MSSPARPWSLPSGWRWATIGDVCTIERTHPRRVSAKTHYVGLEHIEAGTGRLRPTTLGEAGVATKDKLQFDADTILYGKLRPYLNKVALPNFTGVASTDILALRPTPSIDRQFLAFVLRSGYLRAETSRRTNGQLPRIAPKALGEIAIPVPPLDVQHELGAFLQQFADLVDRCHDSSEALLQVPVAHLRTITPRRSRSRSWPEASLEELSIGFDYGMTASAASGTNQRGRGSHRFIRITDIDDSGRLRTDGAIYFHDLTKREVNRYGLSEGDLLFARTGYSIGDTYLYRRADGPAAFASYLIRARLSSDRVDPTFVATLLGSREARATIWHAGRGAGKPNLNIPRVAGLTIPVPPRDIQLEVVALAEASRLPSARLRLLRGQLLDLVIAVTDRALRGRVSTKCSAARKPPRAKSPRPAQRSR